MCRRVNLTLLFQQSMPDIGQDTCGLVLTRTSVDDGYLDGYRGMDIGIQCKAVPSFNERAKFFSSSSLKENER